MSTTTEYQVSGMTCHHCEMSVSEEVGEIPGVEAVEVSHTTGRLLVTSAAPLEAAAVAAAVEEAGYRVVTA